MNTETSINDLLSAKSKLQKKRYMDVIKKCQKKYGIDRPFASDIMGYFYHENDTLESNVLNLLAIANNNMVAGLYSEYKSLHLEKSLNEEKMLKQAAFLFILRNGMIKGFQHFLNEYKGDVKQDVYSEMAKVM